MTPEQHALEAEAGKIIWAAASLTPGVPGHASRTAVLVAKMCALIREVQGQDEPGETPKSPTGRTPEPPKFQQLRPPTTDPEDLKLLLEKYAKPEWRH